MSELLFGITLTLVILLFSWVFGDLDHVFKKESSRKNTITFKYGDEKITFNKQTGKITKNK